LLDTSVGIGGSSLTADLRPRQLRVERKVKNEIDMQVDLK